MLTVLLACASADMAIKAMADEERGMDAATNPDDTGGAAEDSAPTPTHWVLGGAVTVAGGALRAEGTTLEISVVDRALGAVACTAPVRVDTSLATSVPDALFAWWSALVPGEPPCARPPATLSLGFGTLSADLRARLGPEGLADRADALLGAYVAIPDGSPVAFGVAQLAAREGDTGAVAESPDGTWEITPLYAVPLGR